VQEQDKQHGQQDASKNFLKLHPKPPIAQEGMTSIFQVLAKSLWK